MTWSKTGESFCDDLALAGLSDAAYRTHHEAISWIYRVEAMNLRIPQNLVRRFAGSRDYEDAIRELVSAGFWADSDDVYVIVHHAAIIRQSITAQIQKRAADAERQRRKRAREAQDVTRDVTPDVTRDVAATHPSIHSSNHRGEANGIPLRAVDNPGPGAA
jgi:hypothetical protein